MELLVDNCFICGKELDKTWWTHHSCTSCAFTYIIGKELYFEFENYELFFDSKVNQLRIFKMPTNPFVAEYRIFVAAIDNVDIEYFNSPDKIRKILKYHNF